MAHLQPDYAADNVQPGQPPGQPGQPGRPGHLGRVPSGSIGSQRRNPNHHSIELQNPGSDIGSEPSRSPRKRRRKSGCPVNCRPMLSMVIGTIHVILDFAVFVQWQFLFGGRYAPYGMLIFVPMLISNCLAAYLLHQDDFGVISFCALFGGGNALESWEAIQEERVQYKYFQDLKFNQSILQGIPVGVSSLYWIFSGIIPSPILSIQPLKLNPLFGAFVPFYLMLFWNFLSVTWGIYLYVMDMTEGYALEFYSCCTRAFLFLYILVDYGARISSIAVLWTSSTWTTPIFYTMVIGSVGALVGIHLLLSFFYIHDEERCKTCLFYGWAGAFSGVHSLTAITSNLPGAYLAIGEHLVRLLISFVSPLVVLFVLDGGRLGLKFGVWNLTTIMLVGPRIVFVVVQLFLLMILLCLYRGFFIHVDSGFAPRNRPPSVLNV